MGFSTTVNFKSNATFPTNAAFPELRFLNVQKLSLPANTPVGTQVAVTDRFVVSRAGQTAVNAFYTRRTDQGGKHTYVPVGLSDNDSATVAWDSNALQWIISDSNSNVFYISSEDVTEPWLVTAWIAGPDNSEDPLVAPTLTHPALQQLTASSTAQGGVFVAGGSQDGVYSKRGGQIGGKDSFNLLGQIEDVFWACSWDDFNSKWIVTDGAGDTQYYSLSNVATPDLATNWKYNSDDSPASITVTSVTTGQLVSGWKLGRVVYQVNGTQNGRNLYRDVLGVAPNIGWDSTKWTDGTTNGSGNTAFPDIGMADPVASEANWTNI